MKEKDFLERVEIRLQKINNDYLYNNYAKQLLACKLGADITKTYKLKYLWKKILVSISSSCFLLENNLESKIALKSLYKVANILENIAEIKTSAKEYDVDFCKVLSALCYDVSGYQANAYCIVKSVKQYGLSTELDYDISEDNFVIELILNALLKRMPVIKLLILEKQKKDKNSFAFSMLLKAFEEWVNQILDLKENNFYDLFRKAYVLYLRSGNIYISQLILVFMIRTKMFLERSINLKIKNVVGDNYIWKKYIKLLANDYFQTHDKIKEVEEKKSIFEFWTSQIRAIDDGLLSCNDSFVVQMPTSAGKTFIAELFILNHLVSSQKKVLYISPYRALAAEKLFEIGKYFSYLGYKVSSSTGCYDYEPILDLISSDSDVFIFTPEKADSLLRTTPDFFDNISAIVVDEGHIVGDLDYRAALTEALLIKLKIKNSSIKILFISAVMPSMNAHEYAQWLSSRKENVLRSKLFPDSDEEEEWEPARKNIGSFSWKENKDGFNGEIRFENVKTDDEKNGQEIKAFVPYFLKGNEYGIDLINKKPETAAALGIKLSMSGNTMIFCGQVQRIKSVANRITNMIKCKDLVKDFEANEKKESYYYSKLWFGEDNWITKAILYGIGIHYGDMPEQVRSAVEKDFKNQKFKIILCTNTVGQGINFPIKNIIFYDISVGYDEKNKQQRFISHRDFWNIIGRAGRAEKETEGNIIFLINSIPDKKNYENYINKSNIENSQSIISFALQKMMAKRLTEKTVEMLVSDVVENLFLDMVTEEVLENDVDFINNIVQNSLFAIQSDEKEIIQARSFIHKAISKIKEKTESVQDNEVFGKTGLNFDDNRVIVEFIDEYLDMLETCFDNPNEEELINVFLILISKKKISSLDDYTLNKIIDENVSWLQYKPVICAWIKNKSIDEIKKIWAEAIGTEFDRFYILLARGLYYLFPWAMNSLILLAAHRLKRDYNALNEIVRYFPTFIKYGLNNKIACMARILGVKNRQTALFLANLSGKTHIKDFISWIANLQKKQIDEMDLNIFDKENVQEVVFNLVPNSAKDCFNHFLFNIVGTKYEKEWKKTSLDVINGDILKLQREKNNKYDPLAILIKKDVHSLGYVPREYAKYIATEIDLNNSCYAVNVKDIEYDPDECFNNIKVEVNLIK